MTNVSAQVRRRASSLSLANCYFVHDSSGFPVLLRFRELPDEVSEGLKLEKSEFHGDGNYRILPRPNHVIFARFLTGTQENSSEKPRRSRNSIKPLTSLSLSLSLLVSLATSHSRALLCGTF
jgi:hypothetical protein